MSQFSPAQIIVHVNFWCVKETTPWSSWDHLLWSPPLLRSPVVCLNTRQPRPAGDPVASPCVKVRMKGTRPWQLLMGLRSPPPPPHPSGSISSLLEACRCWIWLHSVGPSRANVPSSIHRGGLTVGRAVMKCLCWQPPNEEQCASSSPHLYPAVWLDVFSVFIGHKDAVRVLDCLWIVPGEFCFT